MAELVLRIGFSLLIVFALMWGLARLARRPFGGRRGSGALAVLSRQQLSRGSAVAVVQVHDRALILGITDQQVSLLGEADLGAFEPAPQPHRRRDPVTVAPDGDLPGNLPADLPGDLPGNLPAGRLDGSLLSPRTWGSTLDFLRDRTTRR